MGAGDPVLRISPEDRIEGEATSGMLREEAIAVDGLWAGLVRTEAGRTSGWHHHGDYETAIYVLSGRVQMESGPGGAHVLEATAGDFLRVPPGAIHRETNPGGAESNLIVVRAGRGVAVVNVDAPADS